MSFEDTVELWKHQHAQEANERRERKELRLKEIAEVQGKNGFTVSALNADVHWRIRKTSYPYLDYWPSTGRWRLLSRQGLVKRGLLADGRPLESLLVELF